MADKNSIDTVRPTEATEATAPTDNDIKDYIAYTESVIAETYPLIKKAVSSHAATYMKKDMLRLREFTLKQWANPVDPASTDNMESPDNTANPDNTMNTINTVNPDLHDNKVLFHSVAQVHRFAAILSQIRFSNKKFRTTLTKDVILEKCQICGLDQQLTSQILREAGFDEDILEVTRNDEG